VAVFLQAASAGVMFFIARAPGWERVRLMAAIALTAGLYSAIDVWFYTALDDLAVRAQLVRVNLFVAGLHAAMWMRFTYADESGRVRSMPAWTRWVTLGMLGTSAVANAADLVLDYTRFTHVQVPWLGLDERTYAFSGAGDAVALMTLVVIMLSLARHVRRTQRGEAGALGIVIGLSLYAVCIVEEALVASGEIPFMYLGSPGYVFAVLPLTIQLLKRFGDDARRLAELSTRLSTEVEVRTVERDEARDSLLEQQRLAALGRLAAGVGHEINNPLQYVAFQLEEARASLGTSVTPAVATALQEALDGTQRIAQVVTSLRTYGVRREQFGAVALPDVIRTALRIASPHVRHDATLRTEFGDAPPVLGDDGQLVQMIVNPLVNAVQALSASGATTRNVTLRTMTGLDGWAEISITDTGPGFDDSVLPRLGEPYVTTRAQHGGTGLGLFVTRGLVDAHGGTLTLRNAVDGGAEVLIRLPAAPRDVAPTVARAETTTPQAVRAATVPEHDITSPQVLLVDDEPELLAVMERVLVRLGYTVTVAPDGESALALARTATFDVVISDLMMPRMSGAAFAERLAEEVPALRRRFVVMTGGAVTASDEAFLQREDIVVVNKPVGVHSLSNALTRALSVPLALLLVLSACATTTRAPEVPEAVRRVAGADSVRVQQLPGATRLLQVTWLPRDDRAGPWRASVLEIPRAACVTLGAVKGTGTAIGRTRTSELLAQVPAEQRAIAAVNADFFAFTPAGVPTGAHVERGRVVSGPGARPVFVIDSGGAPHIVTLRTDGWVAHRDRRVALAAWNRWPATGLALLDAQWGVPRDSTADSAVIVSARRLDAQRVIVLSGAPPVSARGDTVLLLASTGRALERAFLQSVRAGDTLAVHTALGPVAPRDAVGGFPLLLSRGQRSSTLDRDGAASFRGVNPRTAIGWNARTIWLVVIDGRQPAWSVGTTTAETADVLAALGADEALNLDGGGSSALVVRDPRTGATQVVNRPSDATGERAVGNALVVYDRCSAPAR
jgi:signal transduction histidine kinase/ActR/RegA family two-component response regulator